MLAPLEGAAQEHRVGASIFRQARYAFQLEKMVRSTDPVLIRIMHTMRAVGGQPLAESDWQSLLATERVDFAVSDDKPDVTGWHHTCYVWSIIPMAAFVEARESARTAQNTHFCIQAVDVPLDLQAPRGTYTQKLYHSFLQVSSLTKTQRLPSFCLLPIGTGEEAQCWKA